MKKWRKWPRNGIRNGHFEKDFTGGRKFLSFVHASINPALAEPQNIGFTGVPAVTVKNVTGANVKKGLPTVTRDGKVIKPNGDTKSPFMVGKDALKGAGKAPARTNSADASGESADTGEYTFGYSEKEVQVSYRYTYHFLQDLTCTYPEDAYTHVLYTYSSSSENIYLVQDANNELGYGEGRIYIYVTHTQEEKPGQS